MNFVLFLGCDYLIVYVGNQSLLSLIDLSNIVKTLFIKSLYYSCNFNSTCPVVVLILLNFFFKNYLSNGKHFAWYISDFSTYLPILHIVLS